MKIAILLFIAGFIGVLHQRLFTSGGWFNWEQFWHHESLIAICFSIGLFLIIRRLIFIKE